MAVENARMPSVELVYTGDEKWLISRVRNWSRATSFAEIFQQPDGGDSWLRVDGYAAGDTAAAQKWATHFADLHHENIDTPALPTPVEPPNLNDYRGLITVASASRTGFARLLPGWISIKIIQSMKRREHARAVADHGRPT
ncbi:hypothetical protein [Mycetocola zhujimingii]|uniref:Uncharacterized protein n=1 Tax=Mycetocola zhujimingii TaxID=2079792 RepID=A0A2U1TE62_9MICO|nr:hypothetical protein [Mycetocola zhujimingii]AWB86096.1 hypothetical protein C3E77_05345 [Mycetocola zhujimingii]PWC07188.1 hypothetical protein DF223_07870 [Mycetocola zhujimingii]